MKPLIGLSAENLHEIITLLNKILANEFVLYAKTLNYHWNVQGPDFNSLHAFFKDLYEQLLDITDSVAERIRHLGGISLGTLVQYKAESTLQEEPTDGDKKDQCAMLKQLLHDHEHIIQQLRKTIPLVQDTYKDLGTGNFLTDTMEKHEKMAWMLRSFFRE